MARLSNTQRLAARLVALSAPDDLKEAVVGDLVECFEERESESAVIVMRETLSSIFYLTLLRVRRLSPTTTIKVLGIGAMSLIVAILWEGRVARSLAWPAASQIVDHVGASVLTVYALLFSVIYGLGCVALLAVIRPVSRRLARLRLGQSGALASVAVVVLIPPALQVFVDGAPYPSQVYCFQFGMAWLGLCVYARITHRKTGR